MEREDKRAMGNKMGREEIKNSRREPAREKDTKEKGQTGYEGQR